VSNRRYTTLLLLAAGLALTGIAALAAVVCLSAPPPSLSLSKLETEAQQGSISQVVITGTTADATDSRGRMWQTELPPDSSAVAQNLTAAGVDVTYHQDGGGTSVAVSVLPTLLLAGLLGTAFFFLRRSNNGPGTQLTSFGRSRARLIAPQQVGITFNDVAGIEEAKTDLAEIVEFLKDPERFAALGASLPRGALLVGPPGTGKTLLAKATAGEAGVPFFSISGSEFVEMFVGVGASRVRDLFQEARKNAPCVVFVDEIDAVGRHRGVGVGNGSDEREQTLNQLLVEMDGFNTDTRVIVVAATNRADVLDPALLRPGRFDRQIVVDLPDVRGRREILDVHARYKRLEPSVDLVSVARQTPGFSGADLANLLNEAAILAARAHHPAIRAGELEEAAARLMAGPERKSRRISAGEKEIIAYHEVGHALVMRALPGCEPVHKVSIVARGAALGWTLSIPEGDRYLLGKRDLADQISGLMGGRVAEELVFGDITSGAANDIQRATQIARRMVLEWGMSPKLGPVAIDHQPAERHELSEALAAAVDHEVSTILNDARNSARQILASQRDAMDRVVARLKEVETVSAAELDEIVAASDRLAVSAS
jgi:cell division protease FtsH